MHPWVWGRMRLYGVQGTQSVRAEDEPETRPIIGEEGSTLRLTTTERRLKPRTSPESQPRLGFTGASKNSAHRVFFFPGRQEDGLAQVGYYGRRFGALQRPFSDRAGTQNSDLRDYQLRQHLREAVV